MLTESRKSALREIASSELAESMSRYAEIWKASNGSWYLNLAADEHGEYYDAYTYGPFSSEESADRYMDKLGPNPGSLEVDDSGTEKPPEKSPNGSKVQKPNRW